MSRRGENIYKRKDGRWEGRYRKSLEKPVKFGYVYGATYKEAKEKLQLAKVTPAMQAAKAAYTVEELCREWLAYKKGTVKESTFVKYTGSIDHYILPHLGPCRFTELTPANMESFVRELLCPLSEGGVREVLNLLGAVLKYGKRLGVTAELPVFPLETRKSSPNSVSILTKRDQEILEQYVLSSPDTYKLGILFDLYTGLRIGELCALKWSDFDMGEGILRVSKTMQRIKNLEEGTEIRTKITVTEPKTSTSERVIPIPDFLLAILHEYQPDRADAYFLTGESCRYIEPRAYTYKFKKYLNESGVRDVNFHTLRHTFATRCVEAGVDVKSLSEMLGHSTVTTTMALYVHPTLEYKRENINKLKLLK